MVAPLIPLIAGIAIKQVAKKVIKRKAKSLANLKNKRQGKMKKEIDKGVNPFPMRVDTRHGGASNAGRSAEGSTKHLLRSAKKAAYDFQKGYKVKTKKEVMTPKQRRKYVKEIDVKVKKLGLPKGYSLKDMEY
tara:strand:- start:22 stop:420 length:399 start_codon:yes stop_codon:yes gene_type:complete